MTKSEFEDFMRRIDAELASQGAPVLQRSMLAALHLNDGVLENIDKPDPRYGPYEGPNVVLKTEEWYARRYPNKNTLPDRFLTRVILINGECFRLAIPFRFNVHNTLEPTELIEDLSQDLIESLASKELGRLKQQANQYYAQASDIELCRTMLQQKSVNELCNRLLSTGWTDLRSCGDGFDFLDPGAALSPAQQASEKWMKAFLVLQDPTLTDYRLRKRFSHNIRKLFTECSKRDPRFKVFERQISLLCFQQDVRYTRSRTSALEILPVVDLAFELCSAIARALINQAREGRP